MVYVLVNWIYNSSAISAEKTQQLESFIQNTKGTGFEKPFLNQFNEKMEDGKITNSEFTTLEESFNGFKLSQLSNNDNSYIKNYEAKQAQVDNGWSASNIIMIIAGIVTLVGLAFIIDGLLR